MERKWNKSMYKQRIQRIFQKANSDIFCIQETKCQKDQIELEFEGYKSYWNSAEKRDILEQQYLQKRANRC